MLEPPSPELQQRLRDWQLCRPGDLRRARRIVRRLAHDLPAFDSVWIDALVQLGCLTPYQARILESSRPEDLQCGDVLILDELGRSAWGHTWFGRLAGQPQGCVVKQVLAPRERQADLVERGRQLIADATRFETRQIVAPFRMQEGPFGCRFLSHFIPGLSLRELLIRRGRFPVGVVTELAYQLATALRDWHGCGQVHGDLRLSHVRIDPQGIAYLVESGLRPVIEPEVTLHATLALEAYDGIAPELIGIGHRPAPPADMYALGCLLWQLLAGRPPFIVADPLAKLAAHQTRTIEDIREWAPETPTELAELIVQLTARLPEQRPTGDDVLATLQRLTRIGRRGLKQFRQTFDVAVPHLRATRVSSLVTWPMAITVAACLALTAALVAHPGARQELLSLGTTWWQADASSQASTIDVQIDSTSGLLPLPQIAPDGTILLTEAGPYGVASIQHAGPVRIAAVPGVCPEILVRATPLRIAAESLQIEQVRIKYDRLWKSAERPRALVMVQAQRITLEGYEQDLGTARDRKSESTSLVGIAWRLVEPADPEAGKLQIRNCLFFGDGVGLFGNQAFRHVQIENTLRMGKDAWFEIVRGEFVPTLRWEASHLTCRESGPLMRFRSQAEWAVRSIEIECSQSVLGLSVPAAALLELDAENLPADAIVWNGESTMIPVNLTLARRLPTDGSSLEPIATDDWWFDGLMAGQFQFAGPPTHTVQDSHLGETDIPRSSPELPGILQHGWSACQDSRFSPEEPEISLELP